MRKPLLLTAFLAVALVIVIVAKLKLDTAIKEGKFADQPGDNPLANTIDIGVQEDTQNPASSAPAPVHQAAGTSKIDVMAALVKARQSFKAKNEASEEARKDPHTTPGVIIQAAETLGNLLTLEQQNPAYKPEFQAFYIDCAKDAEIITVTRVQCLENYVKSKDLSGAEEDKVVAEVDPTVQSLYKELKK